MRLLPRPTAFLDFASTILKDLDTTLNVQSMQSSDANFDGLAFVKMLNVAAENRSDITARLKPQDGQDGSSQPVCASAGSQSDFNRP